NAAHAVMPAWRAASGRAPDPQRRTAIQHRYAPPASCSADRNCGCATNTACTPSAASDAQVTATTEMPMPAKQAARRSPPAASWDTTRTLAPGVTRITQWSAATERRVASMAQSSAERAALQRAGRVRPLRHRDEGEPQDGGKSLDVQDLSARGHGPIDPGNKYARQEEHLDARARSPCQQ